MKRMNQLILLFYYLVIISLSCCSFSVSNSLNNSFTTTNSTRSSFSCIPHQSFLLLQLKQEFTLKKPDVYYDPGVEDYLFVDINNTYPKMKYWKAGSDYCTWDGVLCNMKTGHVIGLDLSNSWLHGPLHSNSSIFSLLHLQMLDLSFNNFSQCQIPSELGQLTSLTHLNLSASMFSGHVPVLKISLLNNLMSLDLSSNFDLYLRKNEGLGMLTHNMTKLRKLNLGLVNLSWTSISESVDHLSHLTYLSLAHCSLQGTIPSSFWNLSELAYLGLWGNQYLNGQLSPKIGNLAKLTTLDLKDTQFSGELSHSIGNLTQLQYLSLHGNGFEGPIPSSIKNLTQLTKLYLGNNFFSGTLPTSLPNTIQLVHLYDNHLIGSIPLDYLNLPSLVNLDLSNNQFTGPLVILNISSSMSQLESLVLSGNKLHGEIPTSISKFAKLRTLDLGSNNFSGRLDFCVLSELSGLLDLHLSNNSHLSVTNDVCGGLSNTSVPKFKYLYLSSCNISEFSEFFKTQIELETLDLSNNRIGGQIPRWLLSMGTYTLQHLYLSNNLITGWEESALLRRMKNLNVLDLSSNRLQGPLVVPPLSTKHFSISNNSLTGRIHPLFCTLSNLKALYVSENHLSGTIPQCLGKLICNGSLQILSLQKNYFHGTIMFIHQTCGNGSQLLSLDLSHNQFHGKIPPSLIKCQELRVLNLGHNCLSDGFPFWLQNLPKLRVLVLCSNKLYGPIWSPQRFTGLVNLSIIDLSSNDFTGTIPPQFFRNWTSMTGIPEHKSLKYVIDYEKTYYNVPVTVRNKGLEMGYDQVLTMFKAIDFSNNKFYGHIPSSIGDLQSLIVLNLSSNGFTGQIPLSLGNLNQLESLDLSNNKLSGEIPQQLSNLTFLGYLNFSKNHLTGPIPQSGQICHFDNSSFEGNWGLCGIPLSKKCGPNIISTSQHNSEEASDSIISGFSWQAVAIGYGFGMVFGMVIEHIIISRRPTVMYMIFGVVPHLRRRRS